MGHPILFGALALIAIGAALGMLLSRNAVYSALFLILNFATVAALYVVLNAPFLAMVQITVYAGAIMVLFLFVIMLLGAERLSGPRSEGTWHLPLAVLLGVSLLVTFVGVLVVGDGSGTAVAAATAAPIDSSPTAIGRLLFEGYVFPFEVTAVLLLVAMIGVIVLRTGRGKKNE
jgi:NADH-quinone oxidoreductase subunit J